MTTDNADELRDIELEIVMTRACNKLAKGTFADLDNKLVNWPLLFTEVRKFIIQDREKAVLKWRMEQVIQDAEDFMIMSEIDEAQIIEWRNDRLSLLQPKVSEGK